LVAVRCNYGKINGIVAINIRLADACRLNA
jgi:hypothetical protein